MKIYINKKELKAIDGWDGCPESIRRKLGLDVALYKVSPNQNFVVDENDWGSFVIKDEKPLSKGLESLSDRLEIEDSRPTKDEKVYSLSGLLLEHPTLVSKEKIPEESRFIRRSSDNKIVTENELLLEDDFDNDKFDEELEIGSYDDELEIDKKDIDLVFDL